MSTTRLRVAGVPEPYNLPWHLAMENGAFAKAGIDLLWHTVPEGTGRMCQMLRDDELDMAVLVTEGAVRDILNGGPHRIVSTFVESPLPWGVHVPARSGLRLPEDLKNVTFAISRRGSGSHLMAMLYAKRGGWTPRDEDFVVVHNMEGAAERMRDGEPVIFLWEKFVTARYVDAGIMRKVDEIQGDWPGFVIVARKTLGHLPIGILRDALTILKKSVNEMGKDPDLVSRVMVSGSFSEARAKEWLAQAEWAVTRPQTKALHRLSVELNAMGLVPKPGHINVLG